MRGRAVPIFLVAAADGRRDRYRDGHVQRRPAARHGAVAGGDDAQCAAPQLLSFVKRSGVNRISVSGACCTCSASENSQQEGWMAKEAAGTCRTVGLPSGGGAKPAQDRRRGWWKWVYRDGNQTARALPRSSRNDVGVVNRSILTPFVTRRESSCRDANVVM